MNVNDEGRLAPAGGPADGGPGRADRRAMDAANRGGQPESGGGPTRPDPGKTGLVINGVIVAVGSTYASTHSLPVTVVAGCAGLACGVLFAWKK